MTARPTYTKPPHLSDRAWELAGRMTLRQLAGQLTSIDPGRYRQLAGEDIALAVARGEIGGTGLVGDRLRELQEIAVANGHPPLLVKDDGRRGFYLVAPFPLYCFDMELVRRAHEQAAADARLAGVTLIRLTCDYAFAQNQGRTQEGGLISDPRFMSEVTRASTEGLTATGRIAVILKHMGPYQYTAGPDYTALPIERTEFLETVLPRYAGGFEAGAHGVMMSFVALGGVPAHADPFLRDLVKAKAGPGAIIESDYDAIYELYGGFGYAASPKQAALRAFVEGGVHIDLCSLLFLRYLPELVEEGRIGEQELMVRAAEMLQVKERVGLLDDPWAGTDPDREAKLLAGPTAAYRDLARASVVLLRPTDPDPSLLPIPTAPGAARLCVLGPLAHQQPEDWLGAYSSHANRHLERVTTPLTGIRKHWPDAAYARGCDHDLDADRGAARRQLREAAEAASLAGAATHVVLFLGESAQVERRIGDAGRAAPALSPAPAGRARAPGQPPGQADRLHHRRPGAAHPARGRGGRRRDLLGGASSAASPATPSPTSSPGPAARPARLSHGLPIADGITSGFDSRQARVDRPAVPVVRGSAARRQRDHWCAYYLGLGARWPAAYYFGEGYSYTTFALSDWSLDAPHALRRRRHAGHRQRPGDQHRRPRRHRDGASLLPGHGLRGAGAAPAGTPRPPAGDARARRVGDALLHGHARRCWPSTAAIPRPARGSGPTGTRRRTPTGCSWSSTRGRRSTPSSASATRPACSLFTLVPVAEAGDDDLGVSARRPEQHGGPRRRRRLRPLAGGGALRDPGGPAAAPTAGSRPPTATAGRS